MSAARKPLKKKDLRNFVPLEKLSVDALNELIDKSIVEELPVGRVIFRQGEKDKRNIYLLEGQIELQITGNTKPEVVKAKTLEAKYPLADTLPRPSTCRAKTAVSLLTVDTDHLEILLEHDPSGTYEVTEIGMDDDGEDSTDWMLRFLQSRAFLQLPTANIQGLLMRLEERPVKRGEIILQQGNKDEFYYIVKQGKCAVSRRPAPKAEDVRLAILSVGDGFGEEALITNGKRNATVTMQENGVLMQLHKKDFLELLIEPLIKYTDLITANKHTKQQASLIDVRTNKAFSENGLEHATNIPLSMLRVKLATLNPTSDYILYCDDGAQSAAAAFLMIQQGLNCKVIRNGISASNKETKKTIARKTEAETNIVPLQKEKTDTAAKEKVDQDQVKFEQHRRLAQEEARKAKAAAEARQAAEDKTRQLKDEADKLRLQAERLAMKTASAETARKQAEDEISRIKSTAKGVKEQAVKESQQMRGEAERLRATAEKELARIQQESTSIQTQREEIEKAALKAAQMAELKNKEAQQAQQQAKAEAERVKSEAESIRQAAMQEAERLRQEMSQQRKNAAKLEAEEAAGREAELIAARQRAEQAIKQAAQAAEDARHQATIEAEAIRQRALEEAEKTRRNAKAAALAAAEHTEAKQREQQQLLDEVRRQAEATLKETGLAARRARQKAEEEAGQIRQQALQEAEQLRRDMESTRKLVEEEAARAKAQITEDSQRHQLAEQQRQREAAATREQGITDAALQEQLAIQEKAEKARHLAENKQHDEQHARELAEAIMQKLADAEKSRTDNEAQVPEGLHVAKATIRRVKDRTILEGDEDIFIFKEPKAHEQSEDDDDDLFTDNKHKARAEASKTGSQDDDELPSFIVESSQSKHEKDGLIPELHVGVANYEHTDMDDSSTHNNRKQLYALAASVTLMIGIGVFSFNNHSTDPLEELAAVSQPAQANATAAENISTDNMASFGSGKSKQKTQAEQEPESKVKKLLSRWKDKLTDKSEK